MARFKLKEHSFKIRDMDVTVRELTQKERTEFTKNANVDMARGPALLASMGCLEPAMKLEEWDDEPSDVVAEVVDNIMVLCGMKTKLAKEMKPEDEALKKASPTMS